MRYEGQYCGMNEDEFSLWETHQRGDLDPYRNLALALLKRSIGDALGIPVVNEDYKVRDYLVNVRADARQWFIDRDDSPYGWEWVVQALNLTRQTALAVEMYALSENTANWRQALDRFSYSDGG